MKKLFLVISLLLGTCVYTNALVINEIMSNPVGDDGGREWVEIYNNSSSTIDISNLSISIKGAAAIAAFPLSGGTSLAPNGYAIIGSVVSGTTKFSQDYPDYNGPLLRSSISLVNTGVTSLEIKINGISVDIIPSYVAAKEGYTWSRNGSSFQVGTPTPGNENQFPQEDNQNIVSVTSSSSGRVTQSAPPLQDLVLYMQQDKTVVAGAENMFSVFGLTRGGKPVDNLSYSWSFGDGGQGAGSSTMYKYAYPGRYITTVEGGNGYITGAARINVRVVSPDITIKSFNSGKYGSYIDIENPNSYELDLSQWRLVIDGASYPFPKNTILLPNNITHITGVAMGFASTTIATNSIIKIVFPSLEEVTRYVVGGDMQSHSTSTPASSYIVQEKSTAKNTKQVTFIKNKPQAFKQVKATTTVGQEIQKQKIPQNENQRDARVATFFRSLFSRTNN